MLAACTLLLTVFTYYVYSRGEGGFATSDRKYYVLLFAVFIRLLAAGFIETDNYMWTDYTQRTLEYGYPRASGDPLYYSYWADKNSLNVFVQHPPLAFYLYAPVVGLSVHAASLLNMLFFVLGIHVLWNFLERRHSDPLLPSLLYLTFPLFYLESVSLFSFITLTMSVLLVGLVNYVEYSESRKPEHLSKMVFCFAAALVIDYTAVIILLFLSVHMLFKNRRMLRETAVVLAVVWTPFALWNLYTGFPMFHNYGFTYVFAHHFNDNLPYGEAVRQYYSWPSGGLSAYFMDTPMFAAINLLIFLNLNIALLGKGRFQELKHVFAATAVLQMLLLTYYAVLKYQSHPIANYMRYIMPAAFCLIPLSLRGGFDGKYKRLAQATILLNLVFILYVLWSNQFQWVTVKWTRFVG